MNNVLIALGCMFWLVSACDGEGDAVSDAAPVDAALPDAMVGPDACVPPRIEVLTNGSFDEAPATVGWVLEPGAGPTPLLGPAGDVNAEADTPPNVAALGGYNAADTLPTAETDSSALGQTNLVIPADGSSSVSFVVDIATQESPLGAVYDTVEVFITDAVGNGPVLGTLDNLDDDGLVTLNIPPGSYTNLVFRVTVDDSLVTLFIIDSVSLSYPGVCL